MMELGFHMLRRKWEPTPLQKHETTSYGEPPGGQIITFSPGGDLRDENRMNSGHATAIHFRETLLCTS